MPAYWRECHQCYGQIINSEDGGEECGMCSECGYNYIEVREKLDGGEVIVKEAVYNPGYGICVLVRKNRGGALMEALSAPATVQDAILFHEFILQDSELDLDFCRLVIWDPEAGRTRVVVGPPFVVEYQEPETPSKANLF